MKVGSLVECIQDISNDPVTIAMLQAGYKPVIPVVKELYVVRAVENSESTFNKNVTTVKVLVEEINNEHMIGAKFDFLGMTITLSKEPCFSFRIFREVQPPVTEEILKIVQSKLV